MPSLTQLFWKHWYRFLSNRIGERDVDFLNYGYWPDMGETLQLEEADEQNRMQIQLYHYVAGAAGLAGKAVLEVSCGHGGGASFIRRYHHPAAYTAVDQNPGAIDYCRRRHAGLGIRFETGDAQVLGYPEGSFDAVLNVEASHCYPEQGAFFRSAARVLRPGGHLSFADFRPAAQQDRLKADIDSAGLRIVHQQDITADVIRALKRLSDRYKRLVESLTPRFLHGAMHAFAAVEGSSMHRSFENGERVYLAFLLQKPD